MGAESVSCRKTKKGESQILTKVVVLLQTRNFLSLGEDDGGVDNLVELLGRANQHRRKASLEREWAYLAEVEPEDLTREVGVGPEGERRVAEGVEESCENRRSVSAIAVSPRLQSHQTIHQLRIRGRTLQT